MYKVDPLGDPRWTALLQRHPRASVFHTPGWLEALRRTYGFAPVVYTHSPPESELRDGVVFCRIVSRLTGRRMVSVPFADHCEPLVDTADDWPEMLAFLREVAEQEKWKYIEIRPRGSDCTPMAGFADSETYYFHALDLCPDTEHLLRSFDQASVQRRLRHAERSGLICEEGRSPAILDKFYGLLLLTRRRQRLPPQAREWFRNLIVCLGERLTIRVVSRDGEPIASILTVRDRDTMVYKYGCSDARFHHLGGMVLLLWRAIQEAKREGLREFDLGRCDVDNQGLARFKDHWGTRRSMLTYMRYPAASRPTVAAGWRMRCAKRVFARVPDRVLTVAGKVLYRHIG